MWQCWKAFSILNRMATEKKIKALPVKNNLMLIPFVYSTGNRCRWFWIISDDIILTIQRKWLFYAKRAQRFHSSCSTFKRNCYSSIDRRIGEFCLIGILYRFRVWLHLIWTSGLKMFDIYYYLYVLEMKLTFKCNSSKELLFNRELLSSSRIQT